MKKLMIAVAAITMAVSANATSAYWGFNSTVMMDAGKFADAKDLSGYSAYLIWANNWDAADVAGSIAKAAVTIAAENWDTTQYLPDYNYAGFVRSNSMSTLAEGTFGEVSGTAAQNVKDFYVVFTDGGVTDYAAYATTAEVFDGNKRSDEVLASANILSFGDGRDYISQSDFAAVPEPTSGLLLLLGVAGLALRRRRA